MLSTPNARLPSDRHAARCWPAVPCRPDSSAPAASQHQLAMTGTQAWISGGAAMARHPVPLLQDSPAHPAGRSPGLWRAVTCVRPSSRWDRLSGDACTGGTARQHAPRPVVMLGGPRKHDHPLSAASAPPVGLQHAAEAAPEIGTRSALSAHTRVGAEGAPRLRRSAETHRYRAARL